MTYKLKTYPGCVSSKAGDSSKQQIRLWTWAKRLLNQKSIDKNKIYSIHAPEVECISKGKVHKPDEFGFKLELVISSVDNWILGFRTFHGNPYYGYTWWNC